MAVLTDAPIDALRSVLQLRLNNQSGLAAAWRETLRIADSVCPVIAQTWPCDPFTVDGFADAVQSGNSAFPMLGMWRSADTWEQETYDWDGDSAICAFKYILPNNPSPYETWPLLKHLVNEMRRYLQAIKRSDPVPATTRYHAERRTDRATFQAAGLICSQAELATQIQVRYGYEGPGGQATYPVAVGTFNFKCRDVWVPDLHTFDQVELKQHLVGEGQDGDADPTINPLVISRAPPGEE